MTARRSALDRRMFDLVRHVAARTPQLSSGRYTLGEAIVTGEAYRMELDGVLSEYTADPGDGEPEVLQGIADALQAAGFSHTFAVTNVGGWGLDVDGAPFWALPEYPLQLATAVTDGDVCGIGFGYDGRAPADASDPGAISIIRGTATAIGTVDHQRIGEAKRVRVSVRHGVQLYDVLIRSAAASMIGRELRRMMENGERLAEAGFDDLAIQRAEVLLDEASPSVTLWSQRTALTVEVGFADVSRRQVGTIEAVEAAGTVGTETPTVSVTE